MSETNNNPPCPCKVLCAPYGLTSVAPIALSALGFIFTCVVAFSCTSFEFKTSSIYDTDNSDEYKLKFGYTSYKVGSCVDMPDVLIDEPLKTGKALGIVAAILGVFTLLFVVTSTFVVYPKGVWKGISAACFVFAAIAAGLVGIGLAADICKEGFWLDGLDINVNPDSVDSSCLPGPSGYVGAIGCLCWIGAGIALCFMKERHIEPAHPTIKPDGPAFVGHGEGYATDLSQEEPSTLVEIVKNPDGSKTKITTSCVIDSRGHRHVEKTIETIAEKPIETIAERV